VRIRRLDLQAFGPFTERTLTMEAAPGSVQILLGRNGAGKSSSLRALSALLFGFPHNTPDAWLHENRKLRLGALLEGDDGDTLEIVRNKGRKDTLRDPDGKVIPEAELEQLLGGMHGELYATLFALDHVRLREAGQQLVSGGEDLGESLFGAGMGRDVHQLLARLRANADGLFLPRGKTPSLNAAISAFKKAHATANKAQLQPASWRRAKDEEARLLSERDELGRSLKALQKQRERLVRLSQVLPLLARFDELKRQRSGLGDPILLPAEASAARVAVMDRLRLGEATLAQLDKRIDELAAGLSDDASRNELLIHGDQIKALFKRLGAQQEASADRVGLCARIAALRSEAQSAHANNDSAGEMEPGRQPRLRKLISQQQLLEEQLASSSSASLSATSKLARLTEQLDGLGELPHDATLRAAVHAVKAEGDLPRQQTEAAARVTRCRATAAEQLARLGLWTGSLDDVQGLPCPTHETVDRFDGRWLQLQRDETALDTSEQNLALKQARVDDELASLEKQGQVPSEEALQAARARRDQGWALVQRAWLDGQDIDRALAAHLESGPGRNPSHRELAVDVGAGIEDSDQAADRLRLSSEQGALLARLEEEHRELAEQQAQHSEQRTAITAAKEQLVAEWSEQWTPASIKPLPPGEMRPWLERLSGLREALDDLHQAEDADGLLSERMAQHVQQLRRGLADVADHDAPGATRDDGHGVIETAEAADLASCFETASAKLANLEATQEEARRLGQRQEQLADALALAQLTEKENQAKLKLWQENWSAALNGLPLREGVTTDEVEAFLDAQVALAKQVQGLRDLTARVAGIDQAQQRFEADTFLLVERCAADLKDADAESAAEELAKSLAAAESAQVLRDRDDGLLVKCREERDECETRLAADRVLRDDLLRSANCQTVEELIAAEERSELARRLDGRLAESREEVVTVGGATDLESLRADVAGLDPDALPGDIELLAQEVEQLSEKHGQAAQAVGAQTEVVKGLDQGALAAEAAAVAENELASVRQLTMAFARQHLAAHLLEREIQRYRQANQGPLLDRAGQLFRRLTAEHFCDLTVAYDDDGKPSLVCIRDDEREVDPPQLSEGEADQLYLALRIASLERHLQRNTPLPFVADDLFVSFDDARAEAGLEVLGDLAQQTQVIFFTHHARLAEIAQQTLGPDRVELFEL